MREDFLKYATEHSQATLTGNYKVANKAHKKLQNIYDYLKKENQLEIFSEFLEDENEGVRLWAATFSLKFDEKKAEKIMKEIMKSELIFSVSAEMTLKMWKEGRLNLL